MGAWHDQPRGYPHHCVQCERATSETGPFHRGATITVAVRGGMGEVDYTLWTCRTCMRTAMSGERSPFQPVATQVEAAGTTALPERSREVFRDALIGRLRVLLEEYDVPSDVEPPVKRGPGRPRKVPV